MLPSLLHRLCRTEEWTLFSNKPSLFQLFSTLIHTRGINTPVEPRVSAMRQTENEFGLFQESNGTVSVSLFELLSHPCRWDFLLAGLAEIPLILCFIIFPTISAQIHGRVRSLKRAKMMQPSWFSFFSWVYMYVSICHRLYNGVFFETALAAEQQWWGGRGGLWWRLLATEGRWENQSRCLQLAYLFSLLPGFCAAYLKCGGLDASSN